MKMLKNSNQHGLIMSWMTQQTRAYILSTCAFASIVSGQAIAAIPALNATYIGGTPTGVNNNGQVVGYNIDQNGKAQGWVYTPNTGLLMLPTPAGSSSTPAAISDTGIIVGNVDDGIAGNAADGAAVWQLNGASYQMTDIPLPSTDIGTSATGVNSVGDIIGTRSYRMLWPNGSIVTVTRGYVFTKDGQLLEDPLVYTDSNGVTTNAIPTDINDNRVIVGDALRMNLNTGVVENLYRSQTTNGTTINSVNAYAVNELGQVAARGWNSQGTFAMYYTDGIGWTALTIPLNSVQSASAYDINDNGDILMSIPGACSGANGALVYFAAENASECMQTLLADQNWQIQSVTAAGINNLRNSAVVASNIALAQQGGVVLTAIGNFPPPVAPSNLVATPHNATATQGFIAIDLLWTDNSDNESGFRIERSDSGANLWIEVGNVSANVNGFRDNNITASAIYDYRVAANGVGGDSFSNVVTVTAPAPVDTTEPSIGINSPTDGATISGNFDITATAQDNVGVNLVVMEMALNGVTTNICNVMTPTTTTVVCSVNAKKYKLVSGTVLPITVTAYDAMQNATSASVTVTWGSGSSGSGGGKGRK